MTIDVKEAVQRAFEHAKLLLDKDIFRNGNVALEEVDQDSETGHWLITLGYDTASSVTRTTHSTLFPETTSESKRVYKVFRIHPEDGHLINMKIRDVATP